MSAWIEMISDEDAGALIMEAREIWFQDGSSDNKE